jgi:acyl carrier protein
VNNINDRIITLIKQICYPDIPKLLNPDAPLVGGDFDSLDFASLLMAVEDEFGVLIDEESVQNVGTLNGLINFVKSKT